MRIFKNKWSYSVLLLSSVFVLNSCHKDFDETTYAPEKPFGGYTSSKEIAAGSLVSYWAFDGNLMDSATNTAATSSGAGITYAAGRKGQALVDDSTAYLLVNPSSALQGLGSFTVSYWMNIPTIPSGAMAILDLANTNSFWGNLSIYIDGGIAPDTAKFSVHLNNNGTDGWFAGNKIPGAFGNWMHIGVTYNAATSTFNLYANGTAVVTTVQAGYDTLQFQNATKMAIGAFAFQTTPPLTTAAENQPWARNLKGQIDELRIYSRALRASDINALFKLEALGR